MFQRVYLKQNWLSECLSQGKKKTKKEELFASTEQGKCFVKKRKEMKIVYWLNEKIIILGYCFCFLFFVFVSRIIHNTKLLINCNWLKSYLILGGHMGQINRF